MNKKEDISPAEIARHEGSINPFVHGLFSVANVDTTCLGEAASFTEPGQDNTDSKYLARNHVTMDPLPEGLTGLQTNTNAQSGCLAPANDEECENIGREHESLDEECESIDQEHESLDEEYKSSGEENESSDKEYESSDEEHESADEEYGTTSKQSKRMNEEPPTSYTVASEANIARTVTFDDAIAYILYMKARIAHQSFKYQQFSEIFRNWEQKMIGTRGLMKWVCALFVCYPDLVQKFKRFLPPGCGIEYGMIKNHRAFRVILPSAAYVRIPNLEAIESLTTTSKDLHIGLQCWIDPVFLNILQSCSMIGAEWITKESSSQTSKTIRARMAFQDRLRHFWLDRRSAKNLPSIKADVMKQMISPMGVNGQGWSRSSNAFFHPRRSIDRKRTPRPP